MGCVGFFKSSYEDIRANAATLAGFLLGNLPSNKRESISKEHVCSGKYRFFLFCPIIAMLFKERPVVAIPLTIRFS